MRNANVLVLASIVGVVAVVIALLRWRAVRRKRANRLPPLFFPLSKGNDRPITAWQSTPRAPSPWASMPPVAPPPPVANWGPPPTPTNGTSAVPTNGMSPVQPMAPLSVSPIVPPAPPQPIAAQAGGHVPAPAPLRVVRDFVDFNQPAPNETVRFRRPADEPVQLLPGRLEVLSGDPRHHEIRFVRVPGRPAELILGRDPGDSAQHVALRSNTVSRQHARFAFVDGQWYVVNLSQTNPVVINGEELSAQDGSHGLSDGDRVELGEVVLRFHAH